MANQMDQQIENSQLQYEAFCDELENDISDYIKECDYTFLPSHILEEYREKYSKGIYVSYTTKIVIKRFEDRLKRLV